MYVDIVPNRKSPPAILIREGWREGGKVKKRTVANISHWPMDKVLNLRAVLKGETLVHPEDWFECSRSLPHGHVDVVLQMMRKLKMPQLIAPRNSAMRSRVLALIAQRILKPASKLASSQLWQDTTLASELKIQAATCDDLYSAMDWLLQRQPNIEQKLAKRHLAEGELALYDISSSYYEGKHCSLAKYGYRRDGKRRRPIIVYGLMTDRQGRPVSIQAWPGNTNDSTTVPEQADQLRSQFDLKQVVLVGDRGMLTQTAIDKLRDYPGLGWISALNYQKVCKLGEKIQPSLFDQRNLAEIQDQENYPGEKLVVCRNPLLVERRAKTRETLLGKTEERLARLVKEVDRRTKKPLLKEEIARKLGRIENQYKMAKHFRCEVDDGHFQFERNEESIEQEAALDGHDVIRTSQNELEAEEVVRSYKALTRVEAAFRSLKQVQLNVRPIYHRLPDRVRAHLLICMLAYYVQWHLRQALAPLLFDDEQLSANRLTRDPVLQARPSAEADQKRQRRTTADGLPVHSFSTLMKHLGTRCRLYCQVAGKSRKTDFVQLTAPTPVQQRALELLQVFPVETH